MNTITVFLIALSLAMDAFAVSVSNGIAVKNFGLKDSLKLGVYFGSFQFIMPLIGWILGSSVKVYIETVDHWIAFILLASIGGNMIWNVWKEKEAAPERGQELLSNGKLILQAVATSIDALAVGISFAMLDVNMMAACSMIGIVAFVISSFGGALGKKLGVIFQQKAECLGGVILIGIGIKILLEHLFL